MHRRYRTLLLGVLGILALSAAARFSDSRPHATQGAEEREVATSYRAYRGKLVAAQNVMREHPRAQEAVFRVANRNDAEARGLLNVKKFDLGAAQKRYLFFPGHINYVDEQGTVVEADPTFIVRPDGAYAMTKAGYQVLAPQFADGVLEFTVDGATVTFRALGLGTSTPATVPHVQGIPQENRVIYPDAFGVGIDYVIQAESDELRKLVVFRTPPVQDFDLRVEFATSLGDSGTIRGRNTKFGATFFRQPTIWDSAGKQLPITVELSGGKMTKVLPASFFAASPEFPLQYPVMTDVTTSYYAGAGDGYVYYSLEFESNWDTAHHDIGTNATANYTGTTGQIASQADSGGYKPMRAFFPIDTSGIANSDEITAVRLKLYATAKTNSDNDGNDYINVVQTTQADTASLVAADFDTCGSIHSPTTGATSVDIGNITTTAYNTLTLNSTGQGWISKTGTTQLGAREGHDLADDIPGSTNSVTFSTSEETGTSQDPVLEVDTTAATITSVSRKNDDGREVFATSTENIDVSTIFVGETAGNTTIEYVIFMDLDGDNAPDTNETYVTNNCAGSAAWSTNNYTHQTANFTIADGSSPKTDTWTCSTTSFPEENGVYKVYVKWYDGAGTISSTGTPSFQFCDQPTGEGSWWDSSWENRTLISFRSSTFSEALVNFPVLVKATSTNFGFDDPDSSAEDVRFTDEDASTLLNFEREYYDATTTKEAYFWVQVPKIATSTDCDYVFMYYDKAGATDAASTTATWRQDYYEAVWHFGEYATTSATTYSFQDGVLPDASYNATEDLNLESGTPTTNQNADTTIQVDVLSCAGGAGDCHALLQWDISSIPASCTVSSGSININVSNLSADRYGIYGVRRNWGETTATWNTYDGSNNWTTAGAIDTTNDRFATDLMNSNADGGWGSGSTGSITHAFDSDGVSFLNDLIDGVTTNNGFVIMDHDSTDDDGYAWAYEGNATATNRPKLTVVCGGGTEPVYLDSTSNNHDETNSSIASRREKAQSKFGYSPKFDGSTSVLGIPDSNGFDITSYTLTGWFRRDGTGDPVTMSLSQTMEPIIAKGYAEADTQAADIQYSAGFNRSGQSTLAGNWEDDRHAAGNDWSTLGGTTIANSVWRHFATRLKDKAIFNLYLDGFANNTTTYPINQGASTGGTMKLGIGTAYNTGGTSDGKWNGYLDELRVYKVAVATSTASNESEWLRAEWYTADNGMVEWGTEATTTASVSISSAANQTFVVNQSTTAISTISITEGTSPSITDANNIRIRIPSTFNMVFYTSDTAANIGGSDWAKTGAISQGGEVAVAYEDSNKTVVVPVTSNFSAQDDITVYGLSFTSFTAVSGSDNLELEVDNGGTIADTDDKTIEIVAPTLSSYASQTFTVSQAMTTSSPMTITDASSATITNTSNIRIRIPTGFNMVWDTADTIIKVAPTLADYTSFYSTNDLPTVTIDVSDVTYNTTTDTLFIVINGTPTIYEYTLGGSLSRTINMNGFIDTEGIDWMYGNQYVLTEERSPYDVIVVTLDSSTTTLAKSEGTVIDVGFTCTTNLCLEGIRYDVANDWFYAVTEKQAGGGNGGRVFRINNDATYTEFTDLGTALSNAGYTDLASLAYDEVTKDLFLLSQENSIIIQATTTGTIRGTRAVDTGIFTQPEGLEFSSNYDSMFIVGEPDDYQRLTRASKINNTATFEDSSKTLVLDVTSDFTASETRTIGFVSFKSFTASSAADNLELEVTNDANIQDYDDKTITITGGASLAVTASTTVLAFPVTSYNFSSQTTTATNAAQGSAYITGGSGTWTLNLNCNASGQGCYWYGPGTRSYSFQDGVSPTAGYAGTEDVNIKADGASTNYNGDTVNCVDYNGDGCQTPATGIHRVLMQWDISSISTDCTVSGASVTVNNEITNGDSIHRFGVYALRRNWGEGTVTWNTYDGSNNWSTAGAGDTSNDRYSTDLMDGNSDGGWGRAVQGTLTFDFDSDGVAQVQQWIDGTVVNNGIIVQDNDVGDTNAFIWQTQENATAALRPRLTVHCKKNSFRLRGGLVPADVPSTTGIFCITDPFTCNVQGGGSCTGVTLVGAGCIGGSSTKTVATGSGASSNYWLKEADWAQGIPGGTSTGVYTTVITWDLQ
ncbi:MAG: hypothetical protein G01um101431_1206 [Parcubacteria group bacterium Gr01-1014_31]|nr:MAG: hypothetical protein G01um101431_1206 [Parcubacteria group bacterium Gr01-1014_31]